MAVSCRANGPCPCTGDSDMEGDGIYVVMAGLIKSSYQTPDDDTQVCARLSVHVPVVQATGEVD